MMESNPLNEDKTVDLFCYSCNSEVPVNFSEALHEPITCPCCGSPLNIIFNSYKEFYPSIKNAIEWRLSENLKRLDGFLETDEEQFAELYNAYEVFKQVVILTTNQWDFLAVEMVLPIQMNIQKAMELLFLGLFQNTTYSLRSALELLLLYFIHNKDMNFENIEIFTTWITSNGTTLSRKELQNFLGCDVYSQNFDIAFNLSGMISEVYKALSEYIHGNGVKNWDPANPLDFQRSPALFSSLFAEESKANEELYEQMKNMSPEEYRNLLETQLSSKYPIRNFNEYMKDIIQLFIKTCEIGVRLLLLNYPRFFTYPIIPYNSTFSEVNGKPTLVPDKKGDYLERKEDWMHLVYPVFNEIRMILPKNEVQFFLDLNLEECAQHFEEYSQKKDEFFLKMKKRFQS